MADISQYIPLGGKTRRFKNVVTGETISRRQFDRLRNIQYERKAKFSKARDAATFYARPAKGRTSALRFAGEIKKEIIEARKEAAETKQRIVQQTRAVKKLERETQRKANKRVHQKQVRLQLLKPGNLGARISVSSYEGYLKALSEMRALKATVNGKRIAAVNGYAVGVVGYDDRQGESKMLGATLWHMRDPDAKPIPEKDWYERTQEFIDEHTYFVFLHWFIHVAFAKEYAQDKKRRAEVR